MNYRLFYQIFMHQLIILSGLFIAMLGFIYVTQGKANLIEILYSTYWGFAVYQISFAGIVATSLTYAIYLTPIIVIKAIT